MPKLPGYSRAVGHWGRRPDRFVALQQAGARVRVALEDKLFAMGRPVNLWLVAAPGDPGVVACTCTKETSAIAEAKCRTCCGSKRAPGFFRFMHETLHASSSAYAASTTGWTLANVELDRTLKPNRFVLTSGSLTGTATTPAHAYANSQSATWATDLAAYRRDAGQTTAAEVSVSGGAWGPLAGLTVPGVGTGTGTLRFRITLARPDATQESPSFEIVRARHAQPELRSERVRRDRPDLATGAILVLKTWVVEQVMRTLALGREIEHQNDTSWTAPLDTFSSAVTLGSVAARITDTGEGPHHFYQLTAGLDSDERYVISQIRYSDQVEAMLTYQSFTERRAQAGEPVWQVW